MRMTRSFFVHPKLNFCKMLKKLSDYSNWHRDYKSTSSKVHSLVFMFRNPGRKLPQTRSFLKRGHYLSYTLDSLWGESPPGSSYGILLSSASMTSLPHGRQPSLDRRQSYTYKIYPLQSTIILYVPFPYS